VTQEAFARAWQRWSEVGRYTDPEGWVRTVGRRIATNRWHKTRNRLTAHRRLGTATSTPGPNEDSVALTAALRRLPAEQRVALVLHHLGGLSIQQIAAETNVAAGTVKARLSRGRVALSTLLSVDIEEHDHA
jgi:RNA polymerase sigma-70 factor, ECF subfamily